MYQFTAEKDESELFGSSRIADLQLFHEHNEVQIQGRLRALFGEPLYETENLEDAYVYVIKATDASGTSLQFSVYQGGSGCGIGGRGMSAQMQEAIEEFKQLLLSAKPVDFLYEGYYVDAYVKIRQGIQEGQILFEEIELDDDEVEEMLAVLGLKM